MRDCLLLYSAIGQNLFGRAVEQLSRQLQPGKPSKLRSKGEPKIKGIVGMLASIKEIHQWFQGATLEPQALRHIRHLRYPPVDFLRYVHKVV